MGRGDFYSDLSKRNREAFSSFSMSQDCLSLFLFLSPCLHRLSLFLFLSPYIHRLSLDFIASLPSPHSVPSLFTVLPRFWVCKIVSWNFLISSPLFLCFFLRVLIASLCFYLGVRLGLEENWVLFCSKRCFGSAETFSEGFWFHRLSLSLLFSMSALLLSISILVHI